MEYVINGNDKQTKLLSNALDIISKSPIGAKIISQASKLGYSFDLNPPGGSSICLDKENRIAMSPKLSPDELVFGMIHEMRHALQYSNGADKFYDIRNNNIKTQTICSRMMEADAQAFTCMLCYDLAKKGYSAPLDAFSKSFPQISNAYKQADSNKIKAAFEAWYDNDDMKSAYEGSNHVNQLQFKPMEEFTFEKSISTEDIASKICKNNGKSYLGKDLSFLEKGKFIDLSEDTHKFLDGYMQDRKNEGLSIDNSYKKLPSRKEKPKDNPLRDFLMDILAQEQGR